MNNLWDYLADKEEETPSTPLATAADEGMFVRAWNEDAPGDFSYGWLMRVSDMGYLIEVAVPQREGTVKVVYKFFSKAVVEDE